MENKKKKRLYCAVYTLKSTAEGLDQDFTSLDAQREAAESYINSQKHEGWAILNERYDDGGFTGANIERPALQKYLLKCKSCGCFMIHSYCLKDKPTDYRYYHCAHAKKHHYLSCPNRSLHAPSIEKTVLAILRDILSKKEIQEKLAFKTEMETILSPSWDQCDFEKKHKILRTLLKEIECDVQEGKLAFSLAGLTQRLEFDAPIKKSHFNVSWHKEKEIVKEPRILKDLIFAHQLQKLLDSGRVEGLKQASSWLHLSQSRLNHILSLRLLSPVIQTEIVQGDPQKIDLIPEYKMISIAAEVSWDAQTQLWRELKRSLAEK